MLPFPPFVAAQSYHPSASRTLSTETASTTRGSTVLHTVAGCVSFCHSEEPSWVLPDLGGHGLMCVVGTFRPSRSPRNYAATLRRQAVSRIFVSSFCNDQVHHMCVTSFENRVVDLCFRAVNAEDDGEVRRLT